MTTTSLVIEIVIIGFQALIWILLIVFTLFDYSWINPTKLKDWSTLLSLGVICISYTLGIIFDHFTSSLFAPLEYSNRRNRWWTNEDPKASPAQMRAYIIATNSNVSEYIGKGINRIRLVRGTALNLILISISSLVFLFARFGLLWKQALVIVILSFLLIILTIFTLIRFMRSHNFYLEILYNTLTESKSQEEQKTQRQS